MVSLNKKIKNFMIIGDSYSTFKDYVPEGYALYYTGDGQCGVSAVEETWWHKFRTETDTNLVLNDSWSGSTVCYTGRQSPEYGYRSSFVNRMHRFYSRFHNARVSYHIAVCEVQNHDVVNAFVKLFKHFVRYGVRAHFRL